MSGPLVSNRRKEMAAWAVANLHRWPTHESLAEADPSEIGCEFVHSPEHGSLPVLRCRRGGGIVCSTVFFYSKRGIN